MKRTFRCAFVKDLEKRRQKTKAAKEENTLKQQ
jgi:hypothetical protein